MSLGMIFAFSFVVRGTVVDDPDELNTTEIALGDEPDELGKGRALVLGLKGMIALWVEDGYREHVGSRVSTDGQDGYSFKARGVTISLITTRSEAQTPSEEFEESVVSLWQVSELKAPYYRWVSVGG